MRPARRLLPVFAAALGLFSCRSPLVLSNRDALDAVALELRMNGDGSLHEIEYHIAPSDVPAPVWAAMNELHPGGPFTGAGREYHGDRVYYEVTRMVGGLEVEAMFEPDGTLHSEKVEIPGSKAPEAVHAAIAAAFPTARVTKFEEIHDGARSLVEYHVKLAVGDMAYKVMLSPTGAHLATFREIVAEIEVPVD